MPDAAEVAVAFNERINAADLPGLSALMSEDHRFIDPAGNTTSGKPACVADWAGFFGTFPGYRNVFESISVRPSFMVVSGCSECPGHPELAGPALWRAVVATDRVVEWRVYEDTPENRDELGLNQ
jgi:ketosteroid isomerase-like protein